MENPDVLGSTQPLPRSLQGSGLPATEHRSMGVPPVIFTDARAGRPCHNERHCQILNLAFKALGPNVLDKPIDVVFRRIPGTH